MLPHLQSFDESAHDEERSSGAEGGAGNAHDEERSSGGEGGAGMKLKARPVRKSRAAIEVSVHVKHRLYVLYRCTSFNEQPYSTQ